MAKDIYHYFKKAIRNKIYYFCPDKIAQIDIRKNQIKLIVFDAKREKIVQWIE